MNITTHTGSHEVKIFTREECQYGLHRNSRGVLVRRLPTFRIYVHDKGFRKTFVYGRARLADGCMWIYNREHCRKYVHPNLTFALEHMLRDYLRNRGRSVWKEEEK